MAAAVSALGGLGDVGDGVRPRRGAGGRAAGLSSCRWLSGVVSGLLGLGGRGAAQRGGGGGGAEARRAAAEVPRAPLEAGTSRAGYTRAAGVTGGSSGGTAVSNPAPVGSVAAAAAPQAFVPDGRSGPSRVGGGILWPFIRPALYLVCCIRNRGSELAHVPLTEPLQSPGIWVLFSVVIFVLTQFCAITLVLNILFLE